MKNQVVAMSAFIWHEGKVLIVQRAADEKFFPDNWELVGGKLEWGEAPLNGLIREVQEEAGLIVTPVQVYLVHDYVFTNERQLIQIAVVCEVVGSRAVTISSEHQAYRWITEDELPAVTPMTEFMRDEIMAGFAWLRRWR